MTARLTREVIEAKARRAREKAGIRKPPVDVYDVARALGIRVEQEELEDDCSGLLVRKGKRSSIIGVNEDHPRNRQRFTVAHEIGHFLLHEGGTYIDKGTYARFRDAESGSGTVAEERQANQFAAALLMPAAWVKKACRAPPFDPAEDEALEDLATEFEVSAQAMMYRLANLRLLRMDSPF